MLNVNFDTLMRTKVFISGISSVLGDFRRFFTDYLAPFTYSEIDDIFDTGGRGLWADLDPLYAARKSVTHPGKGILRREDAYFDAATGPNRSGSLYEVSFFSLVVGVSGSEIPYAIYHEAGEDRRHRPVYDLIVAGERFEERVGQLAEKWTREEIASLERS